MRYLSVCSGIEAASVAWAPLGWEPVAFSEIDPFPCAVLRHHYPGVPNLGDMTRFKDWPLDGTAVDVLVGGTPCQSFSVAGLRAGLADPRGELMLTYLATALRLRPRWVVWENVPGVLSADHGRAFGTLLGGLAECGYGFAHRVLDAQYFGLAQRRARVFVVGHLGSWQRAAAVLFELSSLRGDPAPRRGTGEGVAPTVSCGAPFSRTGNERAELDAYVADVAGPLGGASQSGGFRTTDLDNHGAYIVSDEAATGHTVGALNGAHGFYSNEGSHGSADNVELAPTLKGSEHTNLAAVAYGGNNTAGSIDVATACRAKGSQHGDFESETFLVQAFKASHYTRGKDGRPSDVVPPLSADADKGDQDLLVFDTMQLTHPENRSNPQPGDPCHALAPGARAPAIAFADVADPVAANQGRTYTREGTHNFRLSNVASTPTAIRRLTPLECERLQGFPDGYTAIPYRGQHTAKDGPRYKALGNSMAVPVMQWIGRRIAEVDAL